MQTEAERVVLALQGWIMCWACGEFQQPSLQRRVWMQRRNADMCICTGCRTTKVQCRGCAGKLIRGSVYWRKEEAVSYMGLAAGWQPSCARCARGEDRYGQRTRVNWGHYNLYPDGPLANVPAKRRRRPHYNRRRAA